MQYKPQSRLSRRFTDIRAIKTADDVLAQASRVPAAPRGGYRGHRRGVGGGVARRQSSRLRQPRQRRVRERGVLGDL